MAPLESTSYTLPTFTCMVDWLAALRVSFTPAVLESTVMIVFEVAVALKLVTADVNNACNRGS